MVRERSTRWATVEKYERRGVVVRRASRVPTGRACFLRFSGRRKRNKREKTHLFWTSRGFRVIRVAHEKNENDEETITDGAHNNARDNLTRRATSEKDERSETLTGRSDGNRRWRLTRNLPPPRAFASTRALPPGHRFPATNVAIQTRRPSPSAARRRCRICRRLSSDLLFVLRGGGIRELSIFFLSSVLNVNNATTNERRLIRR